MTLPLDLDAIQARCDAATDGPWPEDYVFAAVRHVSVSGDPVASYSELWQRFADAEFIAHAREDVPHLVAALRELRDRIDVLETALREIASPECGRVMMSDGHYSIDGDAPRRIAHRAIGGDS